MTTGKGHKYNGQDLFRYDFTILSFFYQHKLLGHKRTANRNDHFAPGSQLLDERWRDVVGCGCNDNTIKGSKSFKTIISITDLDRYILITQLL